jgi:hypothetical protein
MAVAGGLRARSAVNEGRIAAAATATAENDAIGPIRRLVRDEAGEERRFLAIVAGTAAKPGGVVQRQAD